MVRIAPRFRRLIVLGLLAVVVTATGGWLALGLGRGDDADKWVTARVARGDIEDSTTALGTLQPLNYVDVGTQVSGQLRRIYVDIGDKVEEGQPLADIDPTIYGSRVDADRAQLRSLKAQLTEKQAQAVLAQELFARQERMLRANATSQEAWQSAQTQLKAALAQADQLRAQINQVESQLKGDEANLGYTKIYAPMAGTVVSQTARQGQTLNANQQAPIIVRIADLATMTVWTQVSEADVPKLKIGQDVYFTTLGQPDRRWTGKLRQVLPTPEIVNNVVLYDALFDVPNPSLDLGIQMSAQVFFVHAAAKDALLVPVAALSVGEKGGAEGRAAQARAGGGRDGGPRKEGKDGRKGGTVLVMKDGTPQPRAVTVGVRNRVQAEILSGLEEGEEVVVAVRTPEAKKAPPQQGGGGPPQPQGRARL